MVAMKSLGTQGLSPNLIGTLRLVPGGALVVLYALFYGRKTNPRSLRAWAIICLFALVDATMFQYFLTQGLQRTAAGLGSVIIDSQPLTVALASTYLYGETLGRRGIIGLFAGVLGLSMLEIKIPGPSKTTTTTPTALGDLFMLLAAQSMAVGTLLSPWVSSVCDPILATGWHMVLGGVPLFFGGLLFDQGWGATLAELRVLSLLQWSLVMYMSVLGGAVGYGLFFFHASRGNLTSLSSMTFLTPVFAATTGYFFLGERLTMVQLTGAGVTLLAVYLIGTRDEKT